MKNKQSIDKAELLMVEQLIIKGQKVAALDGNHLILWGSICTLAMIFQFFAEVQDWASSNVLWLWQPLLIFGFIVSIFITRSGGGRRLGNPVSRAYVSVFSATAIAIGSFLIANGFSIRPNPEIIIILLPALFAVSFFVLSCVINMRWMFIPAIGWWLVMLYFTVSEAIIPSDLLILASATFLFLAVPGIALKWRYTS